MRFCSLFLLWILFPFGFPLAVEKEKSSKSLRKEALSARDDAAASTDVAAIFPPSSKASDQSPSADPQSLLNLAPETEPFSLAQSLTDDTPKFLNPGAAAGDAAASTLDLLGGRIDDVGNVLQQDHQPANLKTKGPAQGVTIPRPSAPGPILEDQGRADPTTGTDTSTDDEDLCPWDYFLGWRTIPWCDLGVPMSIVRDGFLVNIIGYACTFFFLINVPSSPAFLLL